MRKPNSSGVEVQMSISAGEKRCHGGVVTKQRNDAYPRENLLKDMCTILAPLWRSPFLCFLSVLSFCSGAPFTAYWHSPPLPPAVLVADNHLLIMLFRRVHNNPLWSDSYCVWFRLGRLVPTPLPGSAHSVVLSHPPCSGPPKPADAPRTLSVSHHKGVTIFFAAVGR